MLRITPSQSSSGAKTYYTEGLTRQDYYTQGHEIHGQWHGKAASLLGLTGDVDQDAFFALCENRNPSTGENLTARTKENRRVGYDFTFSAPKSVSLLYAMTGDSRIVDAFRSSVNATMRELEAEMHARVRKGGRDDDRVTGNMVWADFVHFTTRPVDGVPDPDLHAHCFAFNATFDWQEQAWKAGQFGDIKRDASYYEAAFHSRLAAEMQGLGFGVERHGKWWDVRGIPRDLIEKFSRRSAEIEAKAAELGITDAEAKGELGARTRNRKARDVPMDALREEWRGRLSATDRVALDRVLATETGSADFAERISADKAMDYAIDASFERASVVSDKQLREAALRRSYGSVLPEEVPAAATRAGVISRDIDRRTLVTTQGVLAEEKAMLAFAREGRGQYAPLVGSGWRYQGDFLNRGQRLAVEHVLRSRDQVVMVRGGAGTGKTTLMREAVTAIEGTGHKVFVFAPSADASRGVLRQEGFADADTVARLLKDEFLQQRVKGQVLWIDEAGLLGVRQMRALFDLADRQDCRVVLSGDTRQHAAVERGDALRLLEERAGIRPAEVTEILRQKDAYRDAVTALSRGEVEEGLARLDALGWIVEVPSDQRHSLLARDYLTTIDQGKTALVISPTHREGEQVTALIRSELREEGRLGEHELRFWTLRKLNLTDAERADAAQYRSGLVVQFMQNAPGITKGERFRIEGMNDTGGVRAVSGDGREIALPLELAARFQVYDTRVLPLAAGDMVRITQNGMSEDGHRLNNGALYQVKGFTASGDIRLDNDWIVGRDYGHLAHGYCTTSHASQGKTVDRVFIAQGAESLPASSREQLYVSVSRGRECAMLYTDDHQALRDQVTDARQRRSASELMEAGTSDGAATSAQIRQAYERLQARVAEAAVAQHQAPTPIVHSVQREQHVGEQRDLGR